MEPSKAEVDIREALTVLQAIERQPKGLFRVANGLAMIEGVAALDCVNVASGGGVATAVPVSVALKLLEARSLSLMLARHEEMERRNDAELGRKIEDKRHRDELARTPPVVGKPADILEKA